MLRNWKSRATLNHRDQSDHGVTSYTLKKSPSRIIPSKSKQWKPIYLLYDERFLDHRPIGWQEPMHFPRSWEEMEEMDDEYPCENPERLRVIYDRLCDLEARLLSSGDDEQSVFLPLQCQQATRDQVRLAHSDAQYDKLSRLETLTNKELLSMTKQHKDDIYYNRESFRTARLAAGGLIACVDAASSPDAETNKSLALVRPPGHHACQEQEMGFCFIDSVVVAAKYALATQKANRICILDWDIHDGNGTSQATIDNENIFRIDIHRFNPKEGFYPGTGSPHEVGWGRAEGLNLNLGWTNGGMGNSEYAAAFSELILPLLTSFKPDMLFISCGLDAAKGDFLGGCNVTPDFFYAMTAATLEAIGANTPVVCALEGGYNIQVLPDSMEAVSLALLESSFEYHSLNMRQRSCQTSRPSPSPNALDRSRKVLQRYFSRNKQRNSVKASAVDDINKSIRIFQGLPVWSNVALRCVKQNRTKPSKAPNRKRKRHDSHARLVHHRPHQRPRIYLWYGTDLYYGLAYNKNY